MFGFIEFLPLIFAVTMFKLWLMDVNQKPAPPLPSKPEEDLQKAITALLAKNLSQS